MSTLNSIFTLILFIYFFGTYIIHFHIFTFSYLLITEHQLLNRWWRVLLLWWSGVLLVFPSALTLPQKASQSSRHLVMLTFLRCDSQHLRVCFLHTSNSTPSNFIWCVRSVGATILSLLQSRWVEGGARSSCQVCGSSHHHQLPHPSSSSSCA